MPRMPCRIPSTPKPEMVTNVDVMTRNNVRVQARMLLGRLGMSASDRKGKGDCVVIASVVLQTASCPEPCVDWILFGCVSYFSAAVLLLSWAVLLRHDRRQLTMCCCQVAVSMHMQILQELFSLVSLRGFGYPRLHPDKRDRPPNFPTHHQVPRMKYVKDVQMTSPYNYTCVRRVHSFKTLRLPATSKEVQHKRERTNEKEQESHAGSFNNIINET